LFEEDLLKPLPSPKRSIKKTSKTNKSNISASSLSPSSSSSRSSSSSYNSIQQNDGKSKLKSFRFHKSLGGNLNKIHDATQGGTCNKKSNNVCEKGDLIKKNNESLENYFLKFDRSNKATFPKDKSKSTETKNCQNNNTQSSNLKLIEDESKKMVPNNKNKSISTPKLISNDKVVEINNKNDVEINNIKDLSVELDQKLSTGQLDSKSFSKLNFSPKFDLKYYSTHSSFTSGDDGEYFSLFVKKNKILLFW
jgi:hypothetical protein